MHVGRLHFRLAWRRRAAALARFDAAACYARLRELAEALDGHPWMVVSGLVEPLVNGRFARAHSDIDIAVPLAALRAAAEAARRDGFVLTTRVLRTHATADADLEAHLCIEASTLPRRARRLRLWRLDASGSLDERRFPAYVDVFPYDIVGDRLHILDSDQWLPIRGALTLQARLPCGCAVPVEHPGYLEALREARRRAGTGAAASGRVPARAREELRLPLEL